MNSRKRWFVTGVSSGIGRCIASLALAQGDEVVATFRKQTQVAQFEAEYPKLAHGRLLDVTHRESVADVIDEVIRNLGPLDVVVNNAGVGIVGAIEELTIAEIRAGFETNVFGPLHVLQAAIPHLRSRRSGHLVAVSSMAGYLSAPGIAAYSGSKFALEGIMEGLATELHPFGIHVTIIEPGPFKTAGHSSAIIAKRCMKEYADTAGSVRSSLVNPDVARGDPRAVAAAILATVNAPVPPLRLPVGDQAWLSAKAKAERWSAELLQWEKVARAPGPPGESRNPDPRAS